MSTDVTMQDLELETAELLPARETLCSWRSSSSSTSIYQSDGNVYQSGGEGWFAPTLNVAVGNGNGDNIGGFL
jgi:hypothetical protein